MKAKVGKKKRGFWRGVGRFFDITRKLILNLLFWGFVVFLIIAFFPQKIRIKENSLIYVKPQGVLVDRVSRPFLPEELMPLLNQTVETSAVELGEVIRRAAEDDSISAMVLELSDLEYASLAVLQDLERDLLSFREKGKRIYAWSPGYNQHAYYLASTADQIYMDEMGSVQLSGFGVYRSYFRRGMDKWNLGMAVFQAGDYKSFVEPFLYEGMSEEVRRENLRWTGNLWDQYLKAVGRNRNQTPGTLKEWIEHYPSYLKELSDREASAAREAGLVDRVGSWKDFSDDMVHITGYDTDSEGFRYVHWLDYLSHLYSRSLKSFNKTVAVVSAAGEIHSGEGSPWTIGAETLIGRLEQAEQEASVRAVVLRLDTGGGSAYASEEIRRTLERIRSRGIPVVVSMGGVSASGGYWIASEADELWAAPGSITGSIGVFSMIPETDRFLKEHLGIDGDGVGTTWMSGQGRIDQPLNSRSREVLQRSVNSTYETFLTLVAENRKMDRETLLPLAGGRIWTGEEAVKRGLCDKTGSLQDAVAAAAALAHLEEYNTWYVPDSTPTVREIAGSFLSHIRSSSMSSELSAWVDREIHAGQFSTLDPGRIYALSPVGSGSGHNLSD